jgi:hypothetical protein
MLADRGALGAVRSQVERRIEHRLLAHPDAVLDHRIDGAADRAMRAYRALHFDGWIAFGLRLGLADDAERKLRRGSHGGPAAGGDAGALEEGAPIHRLLCKHS